MQAFVFRFKQRNRKKVRNLPGYYSGVLRELIGKALFSDVFMDYDVPVEGFYWQ